MYQPYILKYDYQDLEPHISKKTMEAHYNNHYLKYLRKLNEVLIKNNFGFQYPIGWLFSNIDVFPIADRDEILYNAGGVVNHELYFGSLTNQKEKQNIPEPLRTKLIEKFGSIENFIERLTSLAVALPGSGYTFLVVRPNLGNELYLLNLPNQDTPYYIEMIPILAIDVWEHAYYLDYGSNRQKYIEEIIKVIDFDGINKKYQEILQKS